MTERIIAWECCATCGHTAGLHGERAGVDPGRCCLPGCPCGAFVHPQAAQVQLPRPHDDRDLYLAFQLAATKVLEGDSVAGYGLLMNEITRWAQRAVVPRLSPKPPLTGRTP